MNGTMYRPGCYVVHGFEDILPLFGKIESVVFVAGEPILKTARFSKHVRCYVLGCTHANSCQQAFLFSELVDHYPLHSQNLFFQSDCHLMFV